MYISTPNTSSYYKTKPAGGVYPGRVDQSLKWMKYGVWAYFILLIFEGALRKWFLPGLATPLLVIRDPIAIWLVLKCWNKNMLPSTGYLLIPVIIGFISIFTAVGLGHGNLAVAIYGARILLFHFPMMFVVAKVFKREDIVQMGRILLLISIPMVLLIGVQFYSPQNAWVNLGVGGDLEGAGFSGAMGFFRPPGTFSFTNGNSLFFAFVACYVVYFWFNQQEINKLVLILASVGIMISIPLSISRTLLFSVVAAVGFGVLAIAKKPQHSGKLIQIAVFGFIALTLISYVGFFQTALEAFTSRYDNANETEGGLEGVFLDRYLGGMFGALSNTSTMPFFGLGIGMGTNVGNMLLTGNVGFLVSEGEWGRLIGEMGPLFGILIIIVRVGLCIKMSLACYSRLKQEDMLPWFLLCFALIMIPQGQWAQPTSLGFSTLIGGLTLASLNITNETKNKDHLSENIKTR